MTKKDTVGERNNVQPINLAEKEQENAKNSAAAGAMKNENDLHLEVHNKKSLEDVMKAKHSMISGSSVGYHNTAKATIPSKSHESDAPMKADSANTTLPFSHISEDMNAQNPAQT